MRDLGVVCRTRGSLGVDFLHEERYLSAKLEYLEVVGVHWMTMNLTDPCPHAANLACIHAKAGLES